jgi:hypothetical protein
MPIVLRVRQGKERFLYLELAGNPKSLHNSRGKVWVQRIDRHASLGRNDNQIHIFHGNGAEQDLISQHNSADVAFPVLKLNVNRTHVRAKLFPSIRHGHFLLRTFVQLQLIGHVLGNAQKQGSAVGKGLHLDRPQCWQAWIIQGDFRSRKAHNKNMPPATPFKKLLFISFQSCAWECANLF